MKKIARPKMIVTSVKVDEALYEQLKTELVERNIRFNTWFTQHIKATLIQRDFYITDFEFEMMQRDVDEIRESVAKYYAENYNEDGTSKATGIKTIYTTR